MALATLSGEAKQNECNVMYQVTIKDTRQTREIVLRAAYPSDNYLPQSHQPLHSELANEDIWIKRTDIEETIEKSSFVHIPDRSISINIPDIPGTSTGQAQCDSGPTESLNAGKGSRFSAKFHIICGILINPIFGFAALMAFTLASDFHGIRNFKEATKWKRIGIGLIFTGATISAGMLVLVVTRLSGPQHHTSPVHSTASKHSEKNFSLELESLAGNSTPEDNTVEITFEPNHHQSRPKEYHVSTKQTVDSRFVSFPTERENFAERASKGKSGNSENKTPTPMTTSVKYHTTMLRVVQMTVSPWQIFQAFVDRSFRKAVFKPKTT